MSFVARGVELVSGVGKLKDTPPEVAEGAPDGVTPGTIGIVSGDLARFSDFTVSLLSLVRPQDTRIVWVKGMDVTANLNRAAERLTGDWFWIMADDHVFDPLLLLHLLSLNVDVVVPLCLKKSAPFDPVVYGSSELREDGLRYYYPQPLPASGVVEVYAAGSAGMLIRKHVFDALEPPYFETSGAIQDEDLNLCRKIREAGFKIHCAVDLRLGHIGIFGVYPMWQGDRYGAALDLGGGQISPLFAFDPDDMEEDDGASQD